MNPFKILQLVAFSVCISAGATTVQFPVLDMTGATNDVTINIQPVNNPVIWNGQFYWLPTTGTNVTTTNGLGQINLVPGKYTAFIVGQAQSFGLNVINSASPVSAATLSQGVTFYSGVQVITGTGGVNVTNTAPGIYNVDASQITGVNTNGLATTNYVLAAISQATNGLGAGSSTNGLATTNFVLAVVNQATNGLTGGSNTNGLATTNFVIVAINQATNGLGGGSSTNGLATTNYVTAAINQATNGLGGGSSTNGLASTNYVVQQVAAATNSLAAPALIGVVPQASMPTNLNIAWLIFGNTGDGTSQQLAETNNTLTTSSNFNAAGLITAGVGFSGDGSRLLNLPTGGGSTNGLATTNYVLAQIQAATNGLASGGGSAPGVSLWTASGSAIYPSVNVGTNNGWISTGTAIYPQ